MTTFVEGRKIFKYGLKTNKTSEAWGLNNSLRKKYSEIILFKCVLAYFAFNNI